MRYLNRDGTTFAGETARDAVAALRATSRTPGRDLTHFMAAAAAGARMRTGRHVRATMPPLNGASRPARGRALPRGTDNGKHSDEILT